jgi:hypothetical protein
VERLPKVIVSSVIRSAHQGESHGGVYIVDLETGTAEQTIDWNDPSISWEGRGADRGLRGIDFHGDEIYLASSDEIFVYDRQFELVRSFRNRYLRHCHDIHIAGDKLYLTSTGFDSILVYDIPSRSFERGYRLKPGKLGKLGQRLHKTVPNLWVFDPNSSKGPAPEDTYHINSVFRSGDVVYVAGTKLSYVLGLSGSELFRYARIPRGSHNARPFREGVLLNNTGKDGICYLNRGGEILKFLPLKRYDEGELLNASMPQDHARQAFGRGLCILGDDLVAGGSSPATIAVYKLSTAKTLRTVNLTMDVRNAVHGLEVWSY